MIGYGGALEYKNIYNNKIDLKGYLVKEVSEKLRIPVNLVGLGTSYQSTYKGVDCVMVSSTEGHVVFL